MGKLTIQEVAKVLVDKNGLDPKEANRFATEFFSVILQQLQQDEPVKVKGLGTFKIINVEARESVSVRTGERVVIDSHSKVSFTPDNTMKELVNKPFSQFETVVLNQGVEFSDMKDETDEELSETPTPAEEQPETATPAEEQPETDTATDDQPVAAEPQPEDEDIQAFVAAAEPEPELGEEPQPEPEPVQEEPQPEPEPVQEEPQPEPESVQEEVVADDAPEFVMDEEEQQPWGRWLLIGLCALVLMALSAIGGYEVGSRLQPKAQDTVIVKDTVYVPDQQEVDENFELGVEASDINDAAASAAAKEAPKPVVKEETKAAAEASDPYDAKDERVRLGAYRIVGTEKVVTIEAGQTFYSICRAHLGPDMECYVEVYNDLPRRPQLKAGQTIKIPKLELRKRRKTAHN